MDHKYALDITGPTGVVSEVTTEQSGTEGTSSDIVRCVEVNKRFSALESLIQHLLGLFSGADQEKTDTVAAGVISSPSQLSAGLATLPKTNTAMSGSPNNLSSSQTYQGHPDTAPSFIKLADRSISASVPYKVGSASVPLFWVGCLAPFMQDWLKSLLLTRTPLLKQFRCHQLWHQCQGTLWTR